MHHRVRSLIAVLWMGSVLAMLLPSGQVHAVPVVVAEPSAPGPFDEGTAGQFNVSGDFDDVPDAGTLTFSLGTVIGPSPESVGGYGSVVFILSNARAGTYSIPVTATNDDMESASYTYEVLVRGAAPVLSTAEVNGRTLTLTYNRLLDTGSTPAPGDYALTVAGAMAAVATVSVIRDTVTLTLSAAVPEGSTVSLDYTVPTTNPVQELTGTDAATFAGQSVTIPDNMSPVPTVSIATGVAPLTNTEPFGIQVSFDQSVFGFEDVNDVSVVGGAAARPVAVMDSKTDFTVTITPDGSGDLRIQIPARAAAVRGITVFEFVPSFASNVLEVEIQPPPELSTAEVNEETLTLTYNGPLDTNSMPAGSAYTLPDTTVTVAMVDVSGMTVTLTLSASVTAADTVTLSYEVPTMNPVKGMAGFNVAALSGQSVTNNTPPVPTVSLATGVTVPLTNTEPFEIQVTFDTNVSGFNEMVDVTVTGGEAAAPVAVSDSVDSDIADDTATDFAVTITPDGSSDLQIQIPAGVAAQQTRVPNIASDSLMVAIQIPPELSTAEVDGAMLTLTYDEPLDTDSMPAGSAYTLPDTTVTVAMVEVSGMTVTLTLSAAVTAADTVTLSYEVPTMNPVQSDAEGFDVAALSGQSVTNNTPPVPTVSIDLDVVTVPVAGPFEIQVTFDASVSGFNEVGDVTVGGGEAAAPVAVSDSVDSDIADDTATDFAVTITPDGSSDLQIEIPAGVAAQQTRVPNIASDSLMVEIRPPPELSTAEVNEATLTLTYDGPLDTNSMPAGRAYTLPDTTVTVAMVDVSGMTVTLTLSASVTAADTVTLSYEVPTMNPVKGMAGFNVAALSGQSVTNNTPPVPTVSIDLDVVTVPVAGPFEIQVTFDASVSGFDEVGDVTVVGGEAATPVAVSDSVDSNITDGTATDFTVEITPDGSGDLQIQIPAGAAAQQASVQNIASDMLLVAGVDAIAPTVEVILAEDPPVSPVELTLRFSEALASGSFAAGDIEDNIVFGVGGGLLLSPRVLQDPTGPDGDGIFETTIYVGTSQAGSTGRFSVAIPPGAVTDLAGNSNIPANDPANDPAFLVINPQLPVLSIESGEASVNEGETTEWEVALSTAYYRDMTVNFQVAPGDDAEAADFASATTPVTISAGDTTARIEVTAVEDAEVEPGTESITVTLEAPVDIDGDPTQQAYYTLDSSALSRSVTIIDNDFTVSVSGASVSESAGTVSVPVTITGTGAPSGVITVPYMLIPGTAQGGGVDYEDPAGSALSFAMADFGGLGTASQDLMITLIDDSLYEGDEAFRVELGASTVAGGGGSVSLETSVATVTITEDDLRPEFVLSGTTDTDLSEEGDEATLTLTAMLSGTASLPVDLVIPLTVEGTATRDTDYTLSGTESITIPTGSLTAETILMLTPTPDMVFEGPETVEFIGTPTALSVGTEQLTLPQDSVSFTLADDDTGGDMDLTLSLAPNTLAEGDGATSFTVTAMLGTGTATDAIDIMLTASGTATSGTDYSGTLPTLQIASGESSGEATFSLTPTDDEDVEDPETIVLTGTSMGFMVANMPEITLLDNDVASLPSVSIVAASAASVVEGGSVSFTVTATPAGALTVNVAVSESGSFLGGASPTTVSLDAAGTGTLTVMTTDDSMPEAAGVVTASVTADPIYVLDSTDFSASVTVNDNDFTVSISDATVLESAGMAGVSVTITSSRVPSGAVTVPYTLTSGTAVAGTDYEEPAATALVFAVTDFGVDGTASKDITITLIDGNVYADGDKSFSVELGAATIEGPGSIAVGTSTATVTITDDDVKPSGIRLSISGPPLSEDGGAATFNLLAGLRGPSTLTGDLVISLTVDGTATQDADYTLTNLPSIIRISAGMSSASATFTLTPMQDTTVEGSETVVLTGTDGGLLMLPPDSVILTLADDDTSPPVEADPPVADAGDAQRVLIGATVTLDGSGSTDDVTASADLTYAWEQVDMSGAVVTLGTTNPAMPTFTAPDMAEFVTLEFSLIVTDEAGNESDPDMVTITVIVIDLDTTAPTAEAGDERRTVVSGATVRLDGSGSTDNVAVTGYDWTQGTPAGTFSAADMASTTWTAPTVTTETEVTLTLTVTDQAGNTGATTSDTVTVTVSVDMPPTANAGRDQRVVVNTPVALDGSGSRDDATAPADLTYAWTAPAGVTLDTTIPARPTFTPTTPGDLEFSLIVTDSNSQASTADTVTITVIAADTTAPTAEAGDAREVLIDTPVRLDGSGSTDNVAVTGYAWTQTSGTAVTLTGPNAARPTFTAPTTAGDLVFSLRVSDDAGNTSAADTVTIMVIMDDLMPPVAHATADRTSVVSGGTVRLDGSGSTDNAAVTGYAWTQTSGTAVTLTGPNAAVATFTAPTTAGDLVFSLRVSDDAGNTSTADTVTITVIMDDPTLPVARATADPTSVVSGGTVMLTGSGTDNVDGYTWTALAGTFTNADAASTTWTAPTVTADMDIILTLTVEDATGNQSMATVTITVTPPGDVALSEVEEMVEVVNREGVGVLGRALASNVAGLVQLRLRADPAKPLGEAGLLDVVPLRAGVVNDAIDFEQLLMGTDFAYGLSSEGSQDEALTVWARGDWRRMSRDTFDYDGDQYGFSVGLEKWFDNLLLGLMGGYHWGSLDYRISAGEGVLDSQFISLNPYMALELTPGVRVWGTLGHARGDAENTGPAGRIEHDLSFWTGAAGVEGRLETEAGVDTILSLSVLSARASGARLETHTSLRGEVEVGYLWSLEGMELRPLLLGAVRHDGGDLDSDTALEVGGGLQMRALDSGVTVSLRGRTQVNSTAHEEHGVSGELSYDMHSDGLGLQLSMQPSLGVSTDQTMQMDTTLPLPGGNAASAAGMLLRSEFGYGLTTKGGLLRPHGRLELGGSMERFGLGVSLRSRTGMTLELETERSASSVGAADHGAMLHLKLGL